MLIAVACVLILAGCQDDAPSGTHEAAPTRVPAPAVERPIGTAWGIAGVSRAPGPPGDDAWLGFYAAPDRGLGGWQGAFAAWTRDRGMPAVVRRHAVLAAQYGFRSIPLVGFHFDGGGGVIALTIDFRDDAEVAAYTDSLTAFVRDHPPAFLGIGNEMDRIADQDPTAYAAWARRVPSIVAAVHEASPGTQVFATFQLEMLLGRASLTGRPPREPRWALLDDVAGALDVVAFTTYPYFDYETPDAMPASYYRDAAAEAKRRGAKAVGLSEVAWPGAPTPALRGDPRDGSAGEQVAFIRRLPALLDGVQPAFVLWAFFQDPPVTGTPFDTIGLAENCCASRPGLDLWKKVVRGDEVGSE